MHRCRLEKEMQNMAESMGRRTSEPIRLNHFSRSETVLNNNKFSGTNGGGVTEMKPARSQQANAVQTLVVGREVSATAAALPPSQPKTNGFCLTGPVTDL